MNKRWSIGFYVFAVVLFCTFAFCPPDWTTHYNAARPDDYGIESITILASFLLTTLFWVSVSAAGVLLILALSAYRWPVIQYPWVAVVLPIIGLPLGGLGFIAHRLSPWTLHGAVTDRGIDYVFCDSSFLQGQVMALGRIEYESALGTRIKALCSTNGDSPSNWASIVRPVPPQDVYGQLYLTGDRKLVGVRYANHCFLVYDLAGDRFVGREDIEAISPFLCLEADDRLHEPDVEAIRLAIRTTEPGSNGRPHREALEAGLDHPNPAVRALAAEWLELMDDGTSPPPIE